MAVIFKSAVIHNGELFEIGESQALSSELEARLVSDGIAEYVEGSVTNLRQVDKDEIKDDIDIPDYSGDMKMDELKEIMKAEGLKYTVGMSKEDICKMLDEHFGIETDDTAEDNDNLELGAEDPVV